MEEAKVASTMKLYEILRQMDFLANATYTTMNMINGILVEVFRRFDERSREEYEKKMQDKKTDFLNTHVEMLIQIGNLEREYKKKLKQALEDAEWEPIKERYQQNIVRWHKSFDRALKIAADSVDMVKVRSEYYLMIKYNVIGKHERDGIVEDLNKLKLRGAEQYAIGISARERDKKESEDLAAVEKKLGLMFVNVPEDDPPKEEEQLINKTPREIWEEVTDGLAKIQENNEKPFESNFAKAVKEETRVRRLGFFRAMVRDNAVASAERTNLQQLLIKMRKQVYNTKSEREYAEKFGMKIREIATRNEFEANAVSQIEQTLEKETPST